MLDLADRLALNELLHLYGDLVDDCAWTDLGLVFTTDIVYDAREFGMPVTHSLDELVAEWTSEQGMQRHPLAHHATNIVVAEDDDGTVRVRSKWGSAWEPVDGSAASPTTTSPSAPRPGGAWRSGR